MGGLERAWQKAQKPSLGVWREFATGNLGACKDVWKRPNSPIWVSGGGLARSHKLNLWAWTTRGQKKINLRAWKGSWIRRAGKGAWKRQKAQFGGFEANSKGRSLSGFTVYSLRCTPPFTDEVTKAPEAWRGICKSRKDHDQKTF